MYRVQKNGITPLSRKRLALAFGIAAASDALSAFFTLAPPVLWAIDATTAVLLFIALGWRWMLLPGLILEAIPGVSAVPCWLLVVTAIGGWGITKKKTFSPQSHRDTENGKK